MHIGTNDASDARYVDVKMLLLLGIGASVLTSLSKQVFQVLPANIERDLQVEALDG